MEYFILKFIKRADIVDHLPDKVGWIVIIVPHVDIWIWSCCALLLLEVWTMVKARLLADCSTIAKQYLKINLEAIQLASVKRGHEHVDLALLTDGLRAEREQGITIDVAYRYFATPKRKFIIADTPGHIQYTRNMVTGKPTT